MATKRRKARTTKGVCSLCRRSTENGKPLARSAEAQRTIKRLETEYAELRSKYMAVERQWSFVTAFAASLGFYPYRQQRASDTPCS